MSASPARPVAEAVAQFMRAAAGDQGSSPPHTTPGPDHRADDVAITPDGAAPPKPKKTRTRSPRGPPGGDDNLEAYSIKQFCHRHGISLWLYFELQKEGRGPSTMKVGKGRVLISKESATAWRKARERDATREALRRDRTVPAAQSPS